MKKSQIKHAVEIATANPNHVYQYTDGETYYVLDGHRVLVYDEEITSFPAVPVNAHETTIVSNIKKYIGAEIATVMYQLPSAEEIKNGISNLAGRSWSVKVAYGNDKFAINARYLLKAMETLNATVCYINDTNPHKCGIYLYENDDVNSEVKEMILPVVRQDMERVGFWIM